MDERIESGREFQTVGAAAWKEREPKIRLVRGICKRLEEEDDLRIWNERWAVRNKKNHCAMLTLMNTINPTLPWHSCGLLFAFHSDHRATPTPEAVTVRGR